MYIKDNKKNMPYIFKNSTFSEYESFKIPVKQCWMGKS